MPNTASPVGVPSGALGAPWASVSDSSAHRQAAPRHTSARCDSSSVVTVRSASPRMSRQPMRSRWRYLNRRSAFMRVSRRANGSRLDAEIRLELVGEPLAHRPPLEEPRQERRVPPQRIREELARAREPGEQQGRGGIRREQAQERGPLPLGGEALDIVERHVGVRRGRHLGEEPRQGRLARARPRAASAPARASSPAPSGDRRTPVARASAAPADHRAPRSTDPRVAARRAHARRASRIRSKGVEDSRFSAPGVRVRNTHDQRSECSTPSAGSAGATVTRCEPAPGETTPR